MKAVVMTQKEVELAKIIVKAGVRYWNDCKYSDDNGKTWVEAEDDTKEWSNMFKEHIPFVIKEDIGYKESDYWDFVIDINEGKIENWPKGFCIDTWFKVCDDGLYQIVDIDGNVVWDSIKTRYYYVPEFLEIGDDGYGDYIYLTVDGNGYIKDWKTEGLSGIKRLIECE